MTQKDGRRGFISTAAGIGAFVTTGTALAQSRTSITETDVLVAMPGDRYYAIPKADLERYSVSPATFSAEETRRLAADAPRSRGSDSPPPRRPRTVAMGVRG